MAFLCLQHPNSRRRRRIPTAPNARPPCSRDQFFSIEASPRHSPGRRPHDSMTFRSLEPVNGARPARRLRRPQAIDRFETSERRSFREVDGGSCRGAATGVVALADHGAGQATRPARHTSSVALRATPSPHGRRGAHPFVRRDPSSGRLRRPPSPARGEGLEAGAIDIRGGGAETIAVCSSTERAV
jgi:hypothetical protein